MPKLDHTLVTYVGGNTVVLAIDKDDLLAEIAKGMQGQMPVVVQQRVRFGRLRTSYVGYPHIVHMRDCTKRGG